MRWSHVLFAASYVFLLFLPDLASNVRGGELMERGPSRALPFPLMIIWAAARSILLLPAELSNPCPIERKRYRKGTRYRSKFHH
jgi:hypothetical protein